MATQKVTKPSSVTIKDGYLHVQLPLETNAPISTSGKSHIYVNHDSHIDGYVVTVRVYKVIPKGQRVNG